MNYIEQNLLPNETIYFQTRRHWAVFLMPFIFSLIGIILIMRVDLLSLLGYLCFFTGIIQWISAVTTYLTSDFGITNKRVIIKIGFIRRQSWETLLQKIASIEVRQSIFGRILGYGTIVVQSTGGGKDFFHGIDDPLLFRRKVQEQVELTT